MTLNCEGSLIKAGFLTGFFSISVAGSGGEDGSDCRPGAALVFHPRISAPKQTHGCTDDRSSRSRCGRNNGILPPGAAAGRRDGAENGAISV